MVHIVPFKDAKHTAEPSSLFLSLSLSLLACLSVRGDHDDDAEDADDDADDDRA